MFLGQCVRHSGRYDGNILDKNTGAMVAEW